MKTKNNLITKTVRLAMTVTKEYIRKNSFVIDATCGNGSDTLELVKAVCGGTTGSGKPDDTAGVRENDTVCGGTGQVLAMDIQEDAVKNTRSLLTSCPDPQIADSVQVVRDSFVSMRSYTGGRAPDAVVFNLGYLPGGNKDITTTAETTLTGLSEALDILNTGGIVTVVLYSGHAEGAREKTAVLDWASGLEPRRFHVVYAGLPNQKNNPPEILWITKKK